MLKIVPGFTLFKFASENTISLSQSKNPLSLIFEAKNLSQKLKIAFYKEFVLQHFKISKFIMLKTDPFEKIIDNVLFQQDTNKNWHPVVYYLCKILFVERNYKTYNSKLLAIIKGFKTWRHYFKKAAYTILVLTYHNNLTKFMEIICLSCQQIW